ncbi:MAG: type II toxin-antitoxin system RelE family toxin [Candidatus Dormibacteria bacterium]
MVVQPPAEKALRRLGRTDRERIIVAIQRLPLGDVRPLRGHIRQWRLRVGDWRIRFFRDDQNRVIAVIAVIARGGAYKA